jgi:hypothetical protein
MSAIIVIIGIAAAFVFGVLVGSYLEREALDARAAKPDAFKASPVRQITPIERLNSQVTLVGGHFDGTTLPTPTRPPDRSILEVQDTEAGRLISWPAPEAVGQYLNGPASYYKLRGDDRVALILEEVEP